MPSKLRILVVDDHELARAGLAQFIAKHDDITICAEASTGDEAIHLIAQTAFDVVVLDISMPQKNGIDVLRIMKRLKPEIRILVLSAYPESLYTITVLRAGANGYVCKDAPLQEIIKAIRIVARGQRYLSEEAAELVLSNIANPTDTKLHEALSKREFQIFLKLADGQSPTAIGDALNLSVKTIGTYRTRVLLKMTLKSNAQLTHYAIANALL